MFSMYKNFTLKAIASTFEYFTFSSIKRYSAVKLNYTLCEEKVNTIKAPPIIILHGLLGSKNNWKSLCKVFAEKFNRQIFTLDARNHGDSPHTEEFNYKNMVSDVVEFMKGNKLENGILIGHSMGGKTAMMIALLHPELVEKLIVVDISPEDITSGAKDISKYVKALMSVDIPQDVTISVARGRITSDLKPEIRDPAILQFLLTNLVEKPKKHFKWKLNLQSIYENLDHICSFSCDIGKEFTGPTLFIAGENSDYISSKHHGIIKKIFPDSEIKYIPGAGHWVHAEKPNDFLKIVTDFITST
uniref:sn-1-specific diacylglycerol lipase ABHD11 n=1 Tax=Clastoptera arizonana TaxID=38151 RepID=A0A1B6E5J2_9HEMI